MREESGSDDVGGTVGRTRRLHGHVRTRNFGNVTDKDKGGFEGTGYERDEDFRDKFTVEKSLRLRGVWVREVLEEWTKEDRKGSCRVEDCMICCKNVYG